MSHIKTLVMLIIIMILLIIIMMIIIMIIMIIIIILALGPLNLSLVFQSEIASELYGFIHLYYPDLCLLRAQTSPVHPNAKLAAVGIEPTTS